ncbi:hypothetical protein JK636_01530 [Clostridium sp. YIM B02515]|uniref:Uncharacterized protein n=1 Tax=Clostridium rhizosphaerae TaxID=2803861 RepID=A0ABS1T527_9CLOT|nr:hypothetical protein [Clostridium rhizosphaerae]MBL4934434.1 hypothetical protein [Clostridium rhizosphaerae]
MNAKLKRFFSKENTKGLFTKKRIGVIAVVLAVAVSVGAGYVLGSHGNGRGNGKNVRVSDQRQDRNGAPMGQQGSNGKFAQGKSSRQGINGQGQNQQTQGKNGQVPDGQTQNNNKQSGAPGQGQVDGTSGATIK